ncbi:MAG: DUF503 domain-containing protein [candidate division Zixibacteria bacterium]|nr:DUF503 domain-containing protein [candidate division Zixibacteria bacterium]MCI0596850.1 DUF503 domain-containing protein [candidate division Zixibacteria bacterium]
MVIGTLTLELFLPDNRSLKGKRQILNHLKDHVRNRFNVSVAEVGNNELWQRCRLGVAVVSNERAFADQVLSKVVSLVAEDRRAVLLDYQLEIK